MTLEEVRDGDFFLFDDHIFKKTKRSFDYKIIAIYIYDGSEVLFERDTEVEEVM